MRSFHTIAVPHSDILEGRLTMDVFAADLWEVNQGRGQQEYKDAKTFFRKTYLTQGLENLLSVVERRLRGEGGDPVIQIQTPFGGGKTHALIAMYHKASGWGVKKVVIVGTALSVDDTLWGLIEKQLTGKISKLSGQVSPGKEAIRGILAENQPVLILMDELLEYVTKAAGIKVAESTLAAQTIAFMQELTEVAGTLERVSLVVTLPSSFIEHYDERSEMLFQKLQKVAGRVEKIFTPVKEEEIARIIRRRLFSSIDEDEIRKVILEFVKYAEESELIPDIFAKENERDQKNYGERFAESYPFMPEVIDVLYHRWGSYPSFQRTRGVLRLLSLVVNSLKESNKPYISLADFDLSNQDIRQELLKHIGAEYNSVIASDITGANAGAKKVDSSLGSAYYGLNLGTRTATSIFLYSFSGGLQRGIELIDLKRISTTVDNPSSIIAEAADHLVNKLYYLQHPSGNYFFSNQPNLNRILLTKMDNIDDREIIDMERTLLKDSIRGDKFKVFIWADNPSNILDSDDLKLVILNREKRDLMNIIVESKSQTGSPRVKKNTIFFLSPLESERAGFLDTMKRKLAYTYIQKDKNINLSDEQKNDIKQQIKDTDYELRDYIRRFYRKISIPVKDGFKDEDLGIPTSGVNIGIDLEVYEKMRSDQEILEKIVPLVIKEKYLTGKEYVSTEQIYLSSLSTPGEMRLIKRSVLEQGIAEGVNVGLFGLGELENNTPICRYFHKVPSVALAGKEVIIAERLCHEERGSLPPVVTEGPDDITITKKEKEEDVESGGSKPAVQIQKTLNELIMEFTVPKGKVSDVMRVISFLQTKFGVLNITINTKDDSITEQEFDDKVKEAFMQLGIKLN